MKKGITIENISNGLLALQKLKQLYNPEDIRDNSESNSQVYPDKLSLLQETLYAVKDFLPEMRASSTVSEAFRQGSRYSSAYREIKHHVREMRSSKADSAHILKSLKLVAPILNNKQRLYMDKVVSLFEVLQS